MRITKIPYQEFAKEFETKYKYLLNDYEVKIDKARDSFKLVIHDNFINDLIINIRNIQNSLGKHSLFFAELNEILLTDKFKNFENEFNLKFIGITRVNKSELSKYLSDLYAYSKTLEHLRKEEINLKPKIENTTTNLKWKGENITEFTQLIYGLFHAGYLTNDENEITKLVEDVAKAFNVTLSKHWQGNLSKSIHKSNADYEPKIFVKLEKAFKAYKVEQVNKDK